MSTYLFDADAFAKALANTALAEHTQALATQVQQRGHALKHGHLPGWEEAVNTLPQSDKCAYRIHDGAVHIQFDDSGAAAEQLRESLQKLMPWRKGPFQFASVPIDTEWRSDWKWDRIAPHLSNLDGRTVLDVGCGSGYHLWRMHKTGAACCLGIEPSLLYIKQFEAAQHFLQQATVQMLPLTLEALPPNMGVFDTVFSMGVLYHRRDPHEHLRQLSAALAPQGELVLETLVIPDESNTCLDIDGRYANMRNVYELPSVTRLCQWLSESGFENLDVVDVTHTSVEEQRSTQWMSSHSLAEALDPQERMKTIEGHPSPLRATVICRGHN